MLPNIALHNVPPAGRQRFHAHLMMKRRASNLRPQGACFAVWHDLLSTSTAVNGDFSSM
jgi:hypothetical protein